MMSLGAILELTGRLTDQAGANTARERLRRFLSSDIPRVSAVRALIAEAQQSTDEQAQRALGDLVVTLGRFVGCEVAYGGYQRTPSGARVSGTWSAPDVPVAIDVRIVRDPSLPHAEDDEPPPPSLERRNVAALVPSSRRLIVLVPRHEAVALDHVEAFPSAIRVVRVQSVIALADQVGCGRLTCAAALDLLLDPQSAGAPKAEDERTPADTVPAIEAERTAEPHPTEAPDREPAAAADFWIATIVDDEGTAPELMIEKVIRERRVLPASRLGMFLPTARPGDCVCFFVAGRGVVGWGRLERRMNPEAAPVRQANRFASLFSLTDVAFHAWPVPLDPASLAQRLASRSPDGVAGSFLSLITADDFRRLTSRPA